MLSDRDMSELVVKFPRIEYAFAYGSGAIEQGGYDYGQQKSEEMPMVDMIFAVSDSESWHRENLRRNPIHYSTPFPMKANCISKVQHTGAGLWYNTYVPMNLKNFPNRLMKYGVISLSDLLADLTDWTSLYSSGRLHKPVRTVVQNEKVEKALESNRRNAVRASLLMLPAQFSEMELYLTIAGLSYSGDPRMGIAENPMKA